MIFHNPLNNGDGITLNSKNDKAELRAWGSLSPEVENKTLKAISTSVALDPRFVADLKKEANVRGIPYQILMRMFIIEGFQRMKKTGS